MREQESSDNLKLSSNELSLLLETNGLSPAYYLEEFLNDYENKTFSELAQPIIEEGLKEFIRIIPENITKTKDHLDFIEKAENSVKKSSAHKHTIDFLKEVDNNYYADAKISLKLMNRHLNNVVFNNIQRKLRTRNMEKMASIIGQTKSKLANKIDFLSIEAEISEGEKLKGILSLAREELARITVFNAISELLNKQADNDIIKLLCFTTLLF